MASVNKIKGRHGDVFRVQICVKGQRLSSTFDLESEAVRWGEETEYALRNGGHVGNAPAGDMLFDDALSRYLRDISSKKAKSTERREVFHAKSLEWFNGLTLKEITAELAAKYRDQRSTQVGPATVVKDLNMLSHIFTIAIREWAINVTNPVAIIQKPKRPRGRIRFLKQPEIIRLLEESKKSHRPGLFNYISLQLLTGMRPSEGASLVWNQIDLDDRIINLTETKTDPRRVPLNIPAIEVLADQIPDSDYSCSDFVFLPKNLKMSYRRRPNQFFRESFERALSRAGITDFTMHDLRHTAASHMIMLGVDMRTVADILGHKSISMTMKYTHLLDDHKKKAADKIDGLLSF